MTMATAFKSNAALPYIDPADMPDLYAVTGYGRCMEPLYYDGSLLVGDKRENAESGDIVIVYFHRDIAQRYGVPGWIKRLAHVWPLNGEETLFTLEQLNPPRRYIVPAGHIAAMHKCVGTALGTGEGTALYRFPKREAQS
jgi:phage repressor protein C with HTH and peptisase S24 domain